VKKQMFKDKLLAFYQANPKKAVLYAVGLTVLVALLAGGIVFAYQDNQNAKRAEAEKIALQAQQAENARLAAIKAQRKRRRD
jgi:cbb3-type cytochrome oxidase subunit 3